MHEIAELIKGLSSKSVLKRKKAVKKLKCHLHNNHLARLSLHYVSEHDPSYTIRNLARQAFYSIGSPPPSGSWEKHYLFHLE